MLKNQDNVGCHERVHLVELWEKVRLRLPQDIQRLKVADGQNPETIAVVEPPTTMVDALEELPTGHWKVNTWVAYLLRNSQKHTLLSLQDVIADLSTHIG